MLFLTTYKMFRVFKNSWCLYFAFLSSVPKAAVSVISNSSFNPDTYLTTPQIAKRYGYEAESHTVQTEDGYLLTLHRISAGKNGVKGKQPIFLQHGLLSSSVDWVDSGNRSLAFMLADQGYDVWMGNARGNIYSKAHVSLSPSSAQFWNFSWHEMGLHDLPAEIYHISNTTGQGGEILYVGHSMGTTMFFVFSSKRPQLAKKLVKGMVALAPVAYMTNIRSPIKYLAAWVNDIQKKVLGKWVFASWAKYIDPYVNRIKKKLESKAYDFSIFLLKHLGVNQFLPSSKILKFLSRDCELSFKKKICEEIIFVLCGFDKHQLDDDMIPVIVSHVPAGTSTKTVLHYLQEMGNDGKFQQYDYGKDGNMIEYGQPLPPLYDLDDINVPTYLMYADNDWLASPIDVLRLSKLLKRNVGLFEIPLPEFNHIDFLWGRDAPTLVYKPMIRMLKNFTMFP